MLAFVLRMLKASVAAANTATSFEPAVAALSNPCIQLLVISALPTDSPVHSAVALREAGLHLAQPFRSLWWYTRMVITDLCHVWQYIGTRG